VQFENTDEVERKQKNQALTRIGILQPAIPGLNIRRHGEDIRGGKTALAKGTVLKPAAIGVLATQGISTVSVIRRPVVSVLATGDELTEIGQPLSPGKIYNSNTYTIAANIILCGGIPRIIGIGRDSVQSLNLKVYEGLNADMLITSGGVSRGDYDVVKDVLAKIGQIGFWTVRMKPGKPLAFGVIRHSEGCKARDIPHLGLPGNPVSSMITFEMFARPAIYQMLGRKSWQRPEIKARIDGDIINDDGRRVFARVFVSRDENGYRASLTGPQGSGILSSMAAANGLAVVPEDCPLVKAGDTVNVRLLDTEGDVI
jgi:molybdopterin molybdotransferase